MSTIEQRVAQGVGWLDAHYPGWFYAIDLGTLEMSNCNLCVLGQVYTGLIPDAERNQLLAQALSNATSGEAEWESEYRHGLAEGYYGGYQVLTDASNMIAGGVEHGFAASGDGYDEEAESEEYDALLTEWTRVILSRRLAARYLTV